MASVVSGVSRPATTIPSKLASRRGILISNPHCYSFMLLFQSTICKPITYVTILASTLALQDIKFVGIMYI